MTPLQRMADPAEIGAAAAFLASDDSSFMTASELAVDGGLAAKSDALRLAANSTEKQRKQKGENI